MTYGLVFGAITDFAFAILPWFYVSKLRINIKEKITVGVALSMGFFAAICSILKIYYTSVLGAHADFTCRSLEHSRSRHEQSLTRAQLILFLWFFGLVRS